MVFLALANANLRFIAVDVGAYVSQGDARIFPKLAFGHCLHEGCFHIPPSRPLTCTEEFSLPLVMVVDEAFGLAENLMRPYSGYGLRQKQQIFNYWLSRARHVAECAFSACKAKCRVLLFCMQLDMENAIKVVLACCVLHNFCRTRREVLLNQSPKLIDRGITTCYNTHAASSVELDPHCAWSSSPL